MFARLKGEGVRLASDAVRVGAGGHRYFFVHPESTGGVLVEIVGSEEGRRLMRLLLIHTGGAEGSVALAEPGQVVAAEVLPGRSSVGAAGAGGAQAAGGARLVAA